VAARLTSVDGERARFSWSKRPRQHQRELLLPERVAERAEPLSHDSVGTCIAQRVRPPSRVLPENGSRVPATR
jgi:hypothetical protein